MLLFFLFRFREFCIMIFLLVLVIVFRVAVAVVAVVVCFSELYVIAFCSACKSNASRDAFTFVAFAVPLVMPLKLLLPLQ